MQPPLEYGFADRLAMSQGTSTNNNVAEILVQNIPAAVSAHQAHSSNDRTGTDWWVELSTSKHLSVDCKVRGEDWAKKTNPQDDLALETWSVVEKNVVGWTRDLTKKSDYILWLWTDSGRWCLVPFPMLCKVFELNWKVWREQHKTRRQFTPRQSGGYHSECVFVPRRAVWAEMYRIFGGAV